MCSLVGLQLVALFGEAFHGGMQSLLLPTHSCPSHLFSTKPSRHTDHSNLAAWQVCTEKPAIFCTYWNRCHARLRPTLPVISFLLHFCPAALWRFKTEVFPVAGNSPVAAVLCLLVSEPQRLSSGVIYGTRIPDGFSFPTYEAEAALKPHNIQATANFQLFCCAHNLDKPG